LKPYKFINDNTLQHVIVKPSDVIIEVHVQKEIPKPIHVENDIYEPVFFKSIINDQNNAPIIINDIPINNHQNDILVNNHQNDDLYHCRCLFIRGL
jgi:hypothetical protein